MENLYTSEDTIFVQIASYRDPELQHTLQDLFTKAKRPENIFVGICHQYDMKDGTDKHLFEVPFPQSNQIKIFEIDYRETKQFGASWSRDRAQRLYNDEKWVFVIDSHMRFENGWDEIIVGIAKELAKTHKVVLSSYIYGYDLGDKDVSDTKKYISNTSCHRNDIVMQMKGGVRIEITKPIFASFLTTHFLFLESETIKKIPLDPVIYFTGDEVTMAVRLWTSGYNIFVPHKLVAGHLYRMGDEARKNYRKVHSSDHDFSHLSKESFARVAHLCNTKKSNDTKVLRDLEKYSLGNSRTLRDYERFSGMNFKKLQFREKTKQAIFEDWNEIANISLIKNIFKNKKVKDL